MGRIYIPSNVILSRNAEKQIDKIESNANLHNLISDINDMMRFVSVSPLDLRSAPSGWRAEKLKSNGETVCSFRIDGGNRFTYKVYKSGTVEVLGVLGHYKGTGYGLYGPNYDKTNEAITMFYNGDISYEELTKISSNVQLKPSLETTDKDKLLELKEKLSKGILTKEDIPEFEIIDGDNHYYLSKQDITSPQEEDKPTL